MKDNKTVALTLLKYLGAFLAASLAPTAIVLLPGIFSIIASDSGSTWSGLLAINLVVFFVAGIHVVVLGIPAFLLCRLICSIRWWMPPAAGFILGGAPYFSNFGNLEAPAYMGLLGASGGFAFWLVYRSIEPDFDYTAVRRKLCPTRLLRG